MNPPVRFPQDSLFTMAEKQADTTIVRASPDIVAGDAESQGFDAAGTKKLLRKLDWHLIPFMSLIYL
jgi:hypothetical protein